MASHFQSLFEEYFALVRSAQNGHRVIARDHAADISANRPRAEDTGSEFFLFEFFL